MSDSVRPHRRQPTRLPCPWDSPGKNTGMRCHFLLQCMKVKRQSEVTQSCATPWTAAYQAPPPMGVSRQEYWSGLEFPSPEVLLGGHIQKKYEKRSELHDFSHTQKVSSVQFSRSVLSDSLRPHEPQHARPPCPSPTPRVHKTYVHCVDNAIQPSHPLSSPSPPALSFSQHPDLFK